jgi:hypothetical protein
MRYLLLLTLLYAQVPAAPVDELEQDRLRAQSGSPRTMLITVKAQYGDGTPARGYINCDRVWCKSDEQQYCASNLPFATDSRGACGFNPSFEWGIDEQDGGYGPMICRATSGTRSGMLIFMPVDGSSYIITIPGPSAPTSKPSSIGSVFKK